MADPDNLTTNIVTAFPRKPRTKKSECQHSPQLRDQINYGTQIRERRKSVQEYDWEQERMIRYRKIGNGNNYL